MLNKDQDNQDQELDPKRLRLRFGMSKEEKENAKKKVSKKWKPNAH